MQAFSRLSLQTKFVALMSGIVILVVVVTGAYVLQSTFNNLIGQTNTRLIASMERKITSLQSSFDVLRSDVGYLSHEPLLIQYVAAVTAGDDPDTIRAARLALEREYLAFAQARHIYSQIVFIGPDGSEIVRIETSPEGRTAITSEADLKTATDYLDFAETTDLPEGQAAISLLNSAPENDQISAPELLRLNYATPVVVAGEHYGIVLLNLNADRLLNPVGRGTAPAFLVDEDGNYLYLPDEPSLRASLGLGLTLAADFPELEARLKVEDTGIFPTGDFIFAYTPVLIPGEGRAHWHLVTYSPVAEVVAPLTAALLPGLLIFLVLMVTSILLAALIIRRLTSPLRDLAQAADRVATGDLNVEVRADSSDELGKLARAFNGMAANLRTTIASLETQVARRTERLETLNRELNAEIAERQRIADALQESATQFRVLFESSPDAITLIDPHGDWPIVDCNAVVCQINGYTREELIGQSIDILNAAPGDLAEREDYLTQIRQNGVLKYETFHRRKDGSLFPIEVSTSLLQLDKRELILGIDRDITVRRRIDADLQAANRQLTIGMRELEQRNTEAALLNALGELLQSCDDVTEAYDVIRNISQKLFPDEVGALSIAAASRNFLEVVAQWGNRTITETVFAPNDCWALRRGRVHQSHSGEGAPGCSHLSGLPDSIRLCIPLMAHGETFGVLSLCRFTAADPATLESRQRLAQTVADSVGLALANLRLRDTLRNQSIRDSLTDLFNRRYMEETLDRELRRAARGKYSVGVMMIDIDHFKRFNDTYGHSSGDMLLTELGKFFNQNLRGGDIACRYGGEEFTIILPEATLEATRRKAQSLCAEFKKVHVLHDGQSLGTVTLSIGVSAFPEHGAGGDILLRAADAALYRAKRNGRDQAMAAGE